MKLASNEIKRLEFSDGKGVPHDPYTSLYQHSVVSAKAASASDIHIQPTSNGIDIRFRVCGDLFLWKRLGVEYRETLINEVKRLTNMSIAVSGRTQDSRVSFDNELDVRASLLPSHYGEKIVLRLLDKTRSFELEKIGFDRTTISHLREALSIRNGVIIVSGPTGSGKTTTLYSLLCALDRETRNIITLEDPIEYSLPGLTQVQVNSKVGFSDALRAVLRQDPDVILVGEVRDNETASLCLQAAATGHLVFSTLHANGAAEVVTRLLNLGVDEYMLKSCLRFSLAQRLVKKLCPSCALPATDVDLERLKNKLALEGVPFPEHAHLKRVNPQGCAVCESGMLRTRIPLVEYMRNAEIRESVGKEEQALCVSFTEKALTHALIGEIDIDEVTEIK